MAKTFFGLPSRQSAVFSFVEPTEGHCGSPVVSLTCTVTFQIAELNIRMKNYNVGAIFQNLSQEPVIVKRIFWESRVINNKQFHKEIFFQ